VNNSTVVKNLQALVKSVKEQPNELFDMETYGVVTPCGTVCCALGGFAATDEGHALGLSLREGDSTDYDTLEVRYKKGNHIGSSGYRAGAKALGISEDESRSLFNPSEYRDMDERSYENLGEVTKQEVLNRIAELIFTYRIIGLTAQQLDDEVTPKEISDEV
jgi:hypothetical protein